MDGNGETVEKKREKRGAIEGNFGPQFHALPLAELPIPPADDVLDEKAKADREWCRKNREKLEAERQSKLGDNDHTPPDGVPRVEVENGLTAPRDGGHGHMARRLSRKENGWVWTKTREKVALLLAQEELTNAEIAKDVGCGVSTVFNWSRAPEMRERIGELARETQSHLHDAAIAKKARRVRELNERWQGMLKIIHERAADPAMADIPGGKTGLIKAWKNGNYDVDVRLLKELREHEMQAARELGQLTAEDEEHGGVSRPANVVNFWGDVDALVKTVRAQLGLPDLESRSSGGDILEIGSAESVDQTTANGTAEGLLDDC